VMQACLALPIRSRWPL